MAITRNSVIAIATSKEQSTPPPEPLNNEQQQPQPQSQEIAQPENPITEPEVSDYEHIREQRIKENRERLQKLGILDLSLKLKSMAPSKRTPRNQSDRKTPLKSPSLPPSGPTRRSSRLQNVTPVSYTEPKEERPRKNRELVLEEGAKPEVYTEEHEKLLGNTEMPWTFGVDGYGSDGTRIYDPVKGKTCHQCRQKTLGLRTHCKTCNLVQGQFCGDCLYARYGEHVVEASQNPNWICPPCRGICNCSLCRQAKGWAPTGAIYRKVQSMGYKSVAHYLVTTRRASPNSDNSANTSQSAKRALPFEGMEVPSDDGSGQEPNLDDNAVVEKTDMSQQSAEKSTSVGEPKPDSEGCGRLRKRSKKENVDEGKELVRADEDAKVETISYTNAPDASASKMDGAVVDTSVGEPKPRGRGRPRKSCKKENVDEGKELLRADEDAKVETISYTNAPDASASKTDGAVVDSSVGEPKPRGRGRPRKSCKKENVDEGKEAIKANGDAKDETISNAKDPDASASKADSIARRLRSRNRS